MHNTSYFKSKIDLMNSIKRQTSLTNSHEVGSRYQIEQHWLINTLDKILFR